MTLVSVAPTAPAPLTVVRHGHDGRRAGCAGDPADPDHHRRRAARYAELTLYLQKLQSQMRRAVLVENIAAGQVAGDRTHAKERPPDDADRQGLRARHRRPPRLPRTAATTAGGYRHRHRELGEDDDEPSQEPASDERRGRRGRRARRSRKQALIAGGVAAGLAVVAAMSYFLLFSGGDDAASTAVAPRRRRRQRRPVQRRADGRATSAPAIKKYTGKTARDPFKALVVEPAAGRRRGHPTGPADRHHGADAASTGATAPTGVPSTSRRLRATSSTTTRANGRTRHAGVGRRRTTTRRTSPWTARSSTASSRPGVRRTTSSCSACTTASAAPCSTATRLRPVRGRAAAPSADRSHRRRPAPVSGCGPSSSRDAAT